MYWDEILWHSPDGLRQAQVPPRCELLNYIVHFYYAEAAIHVCQLVFSFTSSDAALRISVPLFRRAMAYQAEHFFIEW